MSEKKRSPLPGELKHIKYLKTTSRSIEEAIEEYREKLALNELLIDIIDRQSKSSRRLPYKEYEKLAKISCPDYSIISLLDQGCTGASDTPLRDCAIMTCGECWYNFIKLANEKFETALVEIKEKNK